MLLIGNGCFGELSIILRVTMVCVFFHSIYNSISTGINCPGVSCKYDTYRILFNMYVQIILFVSILVWLIVIVSYALFRLCIVIFVFVDRLFCPWGWPAV
jgi:hypothetical protein